MFASVNPEVAEAKGVAVQALGVIFLVLMGLVVTMAVQVVGTLLLFALVVTPPATALKLSARPSRVVALGTAIGLASVVLGLVTATMFNLPPSFFIVTYSFATWLIVLGTTREKHRAKY
jgi:zinc/manganese transport system permease protein